MPAPTFALPLLPPDQQADTLLMEWEQRARPTGPHYLQARPDLLLLLQTLCRRLHEYPDYHADAEDIRTVLATAQAFSFSSNQTSGQGRAGALAEKALASLRPRWQLVPPAQRALLCLSSSVLAELQMDELSEILAIIQHQLGPQAELIFAQDTRPPATPDDHGLELTLLVGFG